MKPVNNLNLKEQDLADYDADTDDDDEIDYFSNIPEVALLEGLFPKIDIKTTNNILLLNWRNYNFLQQNRSVYDESFSIETKIERFKFYYNRANHGKSDYKAAEQYAKDIKQYFNQDRSWCSTRDDEELAYMAQRCNIDQFRTDEELLGIFSSQLYKDFLSFVLIEIKKAVIDQQLDKVKLLFRFIPINYNAFDSSNHPLKLALALNDFNLMTRILNETSYIPDELAIEAWTNAIEFENCKWIQLFIASNSMLISIQYLPEYFRSNNFFNKKLPLESLAYLLKGKLDKAFVEGNLKLLFNLSFIVYAFGSFCMIYEKKMNMLDAHLLSLAITKKDLEKIKILICLGVDPFLNYTFFSSEGSQGSHFFASTCNKVLRTNCPDFAKKVAVWYVCAQKLANDDIHLPIRILGDLFRGQENDLCKQFADVFDRHKNSFKQSRKDLSEDIKELQTLLTKFLDQFQTQNDPQLDKFINFSNTVIEFLQVQINYKHLARLMDVESVEKANLNLEVNNNNNNNNYCSSVMLNSAS